MKCQLDFPDMFKSFLFLFQFILFTFYQSGFIQLIKLELIILKIRPVFVSALFKLIKLLFDFTPVVEQVSVIFPKFGVSCKRIDDI